MAIREIVQESDPILHKKCRPVEKFDDRLRTLISDMVETLHEANGAGLAAPQVGILRRVVVVDVGDGVIELVNPEITKSEGIQHEVEGCLSCPGQYGITKRPMYVEVTAQDRFGHEIHVSGEGLKARAFCHELDHLDGVLFKEHVVRMLDPEELEELK